MKKLLAIMLALLVCAGLSGCALEKVAPVGASAPVSAPVVIDSEPEPEPEPEPEWNEDEVDAQIPDEYLYSDDEQDDWYDGDYEGWGEDGEDWSDDVEYEDDEEYDDEDYEIDYGITRTLTPAPVGTTVDGNPVDFVISDDLFASQIDEISYFSEEYVGKCFAVIGYVMLPFDLEDKNGFAVVRDYQELHSDGEEDGEHMTAEEFAALIASLEAAEVEGEGEVEAEVVTEPEQSVAPAEAAEPDSTPATAQPGVIVADQLTDLAQSLLVTSAPELDAQASAEPDPEVVADEAADEADEQGEDDHEHEAYPVGIDCYFTGEIPPDEAWVRVVGMLEEYDYYDSEADESFPALRLRALSVTVIPETEGGSRVVTQ